MRKYICNVCGYIYDESNGIPESGIVAGTTWESLVEDWTCPLCGAPKSEFTLQGVKEIKESPIQVMPLSHEHAEMTTLEISALCTNLAHGCEKQYKFEEAALFTELAQYYKASTTPHKSPNIDTLDDLVEKDIEERFPLAHSLSKEAQDRGAMRALIWSEKVTRILKSLLSRYIKDGDAMITNANLHVCTICGFVYLGDTLPDLCPVCKVPKWKIAKVEGR